MTTSRLLLAVLAAVGATAAGAGTASAADAAPCAPGAQHGSDGLASVCPPPRTTKAFASRALAPGAAKAAARRAPRIFVRRGQTSCSDLEENQTRSLRFTIVDESMVVISGGSIDRPPKIRQRRRERATLGFLNVRATTCRSPQGWRILSPIAVKISSRGLDRRGEPTGDGLVEGWGLGIDSTSPNGITVRAYPCEEGWFWDTLKTLNDVPIPGLSYAADVTRFVAGQFFPEDEVECRDLGAGGIALKTDRGGKVHLDPRTHFGRHVITQDLRGGRTAVRTITVSGDVVIDPRRPGGGPLP